MAFRKVIGILLPLLLTACAQVGTLTGGVKDTTAPRPVEGKTTPENGSLHFDGNSFSITFDEYVKINNPLQTVFMVPAHAKPKATLHNKTLQVEWKETLQPNTTYVVYMNETVKDISEGNDSLMMYVFSTGDEIDSLTYSVMVRDAFTNQPVSGATVGLFEAADSMKPYYFATSDKAGNARFNYIKNGSYYLRAFTDKNGDATLQLTEPVAFRSEALQLDSSYIDTVPLRLFNAPEKQKLKSLTFKAPSSLLLAATYPLDQAKFYLNNQVVDQEMITWFSRDSIRIFQDVKDLSEIELVVETDHADTTHLRIIEKERNGKFQLTPAYSNGKIGPHEQLAFTVNDVIASINPELIYVQNPADSSRVPVELKTKRDSIFLLIDRNELKKVQVVFLKEAIQEQSGLTNDSILQSVQLNGDRDYGILHLDTLQFDGPLLVQMIQNNKVIHESQSTGNQSLTFDYILPGDYTFRIIEDSNANGVWDSGDFEQGIQPEKVNWFSQSVRVRANWEIDVSLIPKK